MRFVGGRYFFEVDETLLSDSERSEVRAIAEAGDPYRAQRLAESYESRAIRAIRAASHELDDPRFSEFISEVPEKLISEVPDEGVRNLTRFLLLAHCNELRTSFRAIHGPFSAASREETTHFRNHFRSSGKLISEIPEHHLRSSDR
jgi:hypothetical protein